MNISQSLGVWWRGCAIFSTSVAEFPSAYCCLILKPVVILKAIIAHYFVELMWLATSLQGQLMNCRLFEGSPSV
ncbi:hypothetical protein DER44DRAFT_794030 [Fusarium oxysporum]|nr:hypothetical protein DER44DRAFT_794030 [Fusarium oxysporum]